MFSINSPYSQPIETIPTENLLRPIKIKSFPNKYCQTNHVSSSSLFDVYLYLLKANKITFHTWN